MRKNKTSLTAHHFVSTRSHLVVGFVGIPSEFISPSLSACDRKFRTIYQPQSASVGESASKSHRWTETKSSLSLSH